MSPKHGIFDVQILKDYITQTLIFSMQSSQWYGRFVSEDPGMTIDNSNKYIGIARLREHRSDNHSCVVHPSMRFLTKHCIVSFANGPEFEDFSEGWGNNSESDRFARMDSAWKYKAREITGTSKYYGDLTTYSGGGYIATLGRTWTNSIININYLYRNNWIDRYTRCLFIEFLMYSANSNLFQSVQVAFELSTTGFILTMYNVRTARLLFVQNESTIVLQVVMALFILMVFILLLKFLIKIVRKKKLLFNDLWTLADILIISLSLTCSFLFLERSFLVKVFLDDIENAKHNEFINYFHLFSSETTLTSIAAALVFIATLRLWKLLRFLLIIKIAEKTFKLSVSRLFSLFIYQILLIFLFHLVGRMLYNDQNEFKDNEDSMMTLIQLALCFLKTYDFRSVKTIAQRSYFSLYLITSFFFLTTHVTVISSCYGEARLSYSNQEGYNVFTYLHEQYQYYKKVVAIKMRRSRQRGGKRSTSFTEDRAIIAKANEHRYAKSLRMPRSKMYTICYITCAILRNMKINPKLTKKDENLMRMIAANMIRHDLKDEVYFFVGRSASKKTALVDDSVLEKMERFLNYLLTRGGEEREKEYRSTIFEEIQENLKKVSMLLARIDIAMDSYTSNP
ncbi:hypothetical protein JTB14_019495 [Gonioctena quinquepunctata]|nr:hypothetical protein JTB14_019495 [Gonioctena quinquepunctata]